MKKLIYLFLFITLTTTVITSCTEEEVKPRTENGGGSPIKE